MENSVYVVGDENGGVINVSANNPEYGWVVLRQNKMSINNGWLQNKSVSTIVMGTVTNLEAMNYVAGEVLDGKIIVEERTTPFSSEDRDLKIAGDTGIVCSVGGKPIYRKTFYTTNMNLTDTLIPHDNGDAIRAANVKPAFSVTPETNSVEELEDVFEM